MRTELDLESIFSNSDGFFNIPVEDDTLKRDGGLEIEYYKNSQTFGIFTRGDYLFPLTKKWTTHLNLSEFEVLKFAEECRSQWRLNLLNYSENDSCPFQSRIDFKDREKFVRSIVGKLALAGQSLFYKLFEKDTENHKLLAIAQQLKEKSIEKEMVLTFYSDSFFIPWGFIYTHPDRHTKLDSDSGENFEWEGFWGYRHVMEHVPGESSIYNELERNEDNLISASMNVDELIDEELKVAGVADQKTFFEELSNNKILYYQPRSLKKELRQALEAPDFSDRILYFYCHGGFHEVNQNASLKVAHLKLTDRQPIVDDEIAEWLNGSKFKTHPLVFINACKSAQMTTMFFNTFAVEFLKQGARGLIGAQIDIPAEFGSKYAQALFTGLLKHSEVPEKKVRLGPLMRELTRLFIEEYQNPLGLLYSLYRGADVYADRHWP